MRNLFPNMNLREKMIMTFVMTIVGISICYFIEGAML